MGSIEIQVHIQNVELFKRTLMLFLAYVPFLVGICHPEKYNLYINNDQNMICSHWANVKLLLTEKEIKYILHGVKESYFPIRT